MKRDYDVWRWLMWGTMSVGVYFLAEIVQQLKYIAAAHY